MWWPCLAPSWIRLKVFWTEKREKVNGAKLKYLLLIGLLLPTVVLGQMKDPVLESSQENPTTLSQDTVSYSSEHGEFRVIFPVGCGKLVTKVPKEEPAMEDGLPAVAVTLTFCDRYQKKGEGCSVSSFFNVLGEDGGSPGAEQVVERVVRFLKTMKVAINHEAPVRKELPDGTVIEGIDVLASDPSGAGQTWVRGLLYEGDIYVMVAWKNTGRLWDDPDFQNFFNSFQPGASD